jgi:hypothetical protein
LDGLGGNAGSGGQIEEREQQRERERTLEYYLSAHHRASVPFMSAAAASGASPGAASDCVLLDRNADVIDARFGADLSPSDLLDGMNHRHRAGVWLPMARAADRGQRNR